MAQTFDIGSDIVISPGSGYEVTPRVRKAQFGDGYVQRSGDGINTQAKVFSVTLSSLTKAESDYVLGFFEAHGGFEHFLWTRPGATVAEKWIASTWRATTVAYNVVDIEATFEQVFDM